MTWNFCCRHCIKTYTRAFWFFFIDSLPIPCHPSPFPSLPLTSTQQSSSSLEIQKKQKVGGVADHRLVVGWARSAHLIGSCPFFFGLALVLCVQLCMRLLSRPWPPPPPTTPLSPSHNLFKNDGTVPTTTASEPRSSRVSRGDHHQSEPQSLPSRSCSAQLRTTASTTQPSSFLFSWSAAKLSSIGQSQRQFRHDERKHQCSVRIRQSRLRLLRASRLFVCRRCRPAATILHRQHSFNVRNASLGEFTRVSADSTVKWFLFVIQHVSSHAAAAAASCRTTTTSSH